MVCLCPGRTFETPWRAGGRAFVSPWALRHLAHLRFARDLDDPGAPQVIGVALDLNVLRAAKYPLPFFRHPPLGCFLLEELTRSADIKLNERV